jgi:hypothetical protein
MYNIRFYSYIQADELGVTIYPSRNPKYKIDVYKGDKFLCSIGDSRYLDFPSYEEKYGRRYALFRRKLYKIRHAKDRSVVGSRGYYAYKILW